MKKLNNIILSSISALAILAGATAFAQNTPATADADKVVEAGLQPPAAENSFDDYAVIVEKNIFGYLVTAATPPEPTELEIPAELAPLPDANGVTATAPDSSQYVLTGIVEIGDKKKAIIQDTAADIGFYVAPGDAVNEYTLKEIGEKSAILENNGLELHLVLEESKAAPEPASQPIVDEEVEKLTPEMIPYPQRGRLGSQ